MTLDLDDEDRVEAPKDQFTGWVQLILVGGVIVGALVATNLMNSAAINDVPQTATVAMPTVEVFQPRIASSVVDVRETGVVELRSTVNVVPQVSGRVLAISTDFASGGVFTAGQVLFEIDPTDAQLEVRRLRADLDTARRALELEIVEAETAAREWESINPGEPIPPVVAREPQRAQAEASVEAANARLAIAEVTLGRTNVSVPFDGRVLESALEIGQTVSANQSYGTVYSENALEISLPLSEADLARLQPVLGRRANIWPRSGASTIPILAEVVRVDSQLDPRTRQAGLILKPEANHGLLPGAFVEATLESEPTTSTIKLPRSVVGTENQVWVVEDGALQGRMPNRIGTFGDELVFEAFDTADGVVVLAPPGARDGLDVSPVQVLQLTSGDAE